MPGSWKDRFPLPTLEDVDLLGLNLLPHKALQQALAGRLGLPADQVLPTAGTTGANTAAIHFAVTPGSRVLCERPYYAPLPGVAAGLGAKVETFDRIFEKDWALDWDALEAMGGSNVSLILLASPNNPTGVALQETDYDRLQVLADAWDCWVLIDAVFDELSGGPLPSRGRSRILTTSGFNKTWGAPALRVGWLVGPAKVLHQVGDIHRHLFMAGSPLGEDLALALMEHEEVCKNQLQEHLQQVHAAYDAWVASEPLVEDVPAQGLVAFPRLMGISDTETFCKQAAAEGLVVLPGEFFGMAGHVRVGLGDRLENLQPAWAQLSRLLHQATD